VLHRDILPTMVRDRKPSTVSGSALCRCTISASPQATLVLAILLFGLAAPARAQQVRRLEGRVIEAETGQPMPATNIVVLETNRGTISNADGAWLLLLPEGPATLVFSFVGYRSDTLRVAPFGNVRYDAVLEQVVLENPPITVYGADPARAILRRAIAAKDSLRTGLESYIFEAYTRGTITREDSIAGISESFTTGYWRLGKPMREEIRQRRTTENLPDMTGIQGVLGFQDFAADDIEVAGNRYVGPLHPDALKWYDPVLVETEWQNGLAVYRIALEPVSRLVPLLRGEVRIADGSWALVGVDLVPAEVIPIPFVRDLLMHWRQSFRLHQDYWLPAELRLEAGMTIEIGPISIPRMGIRQTSVIYDYQVNAAIPDSIFERSDNVIALPEAASVDSLYWRTNAFLPLTHEEERSYTRLDSTQTLERQFAPRGFGMTFSGDEDSLSIGLGARSGPLGRAFGRLLPGLDFWYDRVEGAHLGYRFDLNPFGGPLTLRARGGQGLSAELWSWETSVRLRLRRGGLPGPRGGGRIGLTLEAALYDRVAASPDAGFYPSLLNTLMTLLLKEDYPDYHRAHGGRLGLVLGRETGRRLELYGARERHAALPVVTNWSLNRRDRLSRPNPPAEEGEVDRYGAVLTLGRPESDAGVMTGRGLRLWAERGSGELDGRERNWTRVDGVLSFAVPTLSARWFFPPQLVVRLAGSWSEGPLPVQLWGAPETSLGLYGPLGTLRAADPRELAGTRWAAATAEHNFRNLLFRMLGLDGLADRGIDILVHGGVAGARRELPDGTRLRLPAEGVYAEAGVGIGRLWDIFRLDVTHQLTGARRWVLTLALTTFY
jgi:hypothetical protein